MDVGLHEVHSPPEGVAAVANVCFVHGLFGGPRKSFTAKKTRRTGEEVIAPATNGGSSNKGSQEIFWPRDLLPLVAKNARIFTFGYDADAGRFMAAAGLNSLYQHARNLLNAVSDLLDESSEPLPIIFVAHSLGGLVVKQALNQSATTTDARRNRALSYVRGIIFLGTPHHGSSAASYGRLAFRLSKTLPFQSTNLKLLAALERNSDQLDQLSTEFCETLEKTNSLRLWSFVEEKQVRFGPIGMQIVPADSARIRHVKEDWGTISGDHREIAKYAEAKDEGFVKVSNILKRWTEDIKRDESKPLPSTEYKECLETLDDPAARQRVQGVDQVSQTSPSSFEWLFTDAVPFSRWLQDDTDLFGPLFWITGRPGSGKSTLMRFALEDKRTLELLPESSGEPVAYFFHLRGKSTTQKSLKGMLKELLYQLLRQFPHFYEQIGPIYRKGVMMQDPRDWELESLMEGLMQIPRFSSKSSPSRDRVFLFIDALDENENRGDNEAMMNLIKHLSCEYTGRRNQTTPLLKICLASRSWPLFQKELGNDAQIPSFAIHDFTMDDIQSYASSLLTAALETWHIPSARQDSCQRLATEIMRRANGVFIWVRVVVDDSRRHIIDGTSIEILMSKILEYPEELDDLYEYTVKRIPGDYTSELRVALKVLYSSRVALTLTQLYVITQICIRQIPSDDFKASRQTAAWLASRSGGLIEEITIDDSSNCDSGQQQVEPTSTVQFIHQTVQEYVRTGIKGLQEPTEKEPSTANQHGHYLIAFACLQTFPPHQCLFTLAENTFSYLRESERVWDTDDHHGKPYIDELEERLRTFLSFQVVHEPNPSQSIQRFRTPQRISEEATEEEWLENMETESKRGVHSLTRTWLQTLRYYMNERQRRQMVTLITEMQHLSTPVTRLPVTHRIMNRSSQSSMPATATSTTGPVVKRANFSRTPEGAARAKLRLKWAIKVVMALNACDEALFTNIIIITQNLYYPRIHALKKSTGGLTITMAAVGQRLTEDRTDHARMLGRFLAQPWSFDHRLKLVSQPPCVALLVAPSGNILWNRNSSPLDIITTANSNNGITDRTMRQMAGMMVASGMCGSAWNRVYVDLARTQPISLLSFCARFKGGTCEVWLQELLKHRYPASLLDDLQLPLTQYERAFLSAMGVTFDAEKQPDNDEAPRDVRHSLMFASLKSALWPGIRPRYLLQGCMDPRDRAYMYP